ncbi:MAG: hypothetical protein QXV22_04560, partial [Thermoplasmataceae archaeon]
MKRYIVALSAILVLAVALMPAVSAQTPSKVPATRTPIKHIVNIFLENHSFDNLFGIYPYDKYSKNASISANLSTPLNLLSNKTLLAKLSEVPPGVF